MIKHILSYVYHNLIKEGFFKDDKELYILSYVQKALLLSKYNSLGRSRIACWRQIEMKNPGILQMNGKLPMVLLENLSGKDRFTYPPCMAIWCQYIGTKDAASNKKEGTQTVSQYRQKRNQGTFRRFQLNFSVLQNNLNRKKLEDLC